jgi:hypothetical protein
MGMGNFANRKVHKVGFATDLGTFAELSEKLSKQGFEYQYKAGQPSYSDTGIARFLHSKTGKRKTMKRVERGKPAMTLPRPKGATSWLSRTHATPDVWAILGRRKK